MKATDTQAKKNVFECVVKIYFEITGIETDFGLPAGAEAVGDGKFIKVGGNAVEDEEKVIEEGKAFGKVGPLDPV